jgi:hyperosmotically inducible protein
MNALAGTSKIVLASALLVGALVGCNKAEQTGAAGSAGTPPASTASTSTPPASGSASSGTGGDTSGASSSSSTSAGAKIDDSIITTKVKTALLADSTVKGTDISVETKEGEVMLSGFVGDQAQIDKAKQIAQNVEGVKNVNNKMTVKQ